MRSPTRSCPISTDFTFRKLLSVLACWLACSGGLWAGGGPEDVFLVVNPLSSDSMTIANHYCQMRQIPSLNIFYLEWSGPQEVINVEIFREQILKPVFQEIARRRLQTQVDYIVYSSGYPYGVNFSQDVQGTGSRESGVVGSLTGLTFHNQRVLNREASYAFSVQNRQSNFYLNRATRAFSSDIGWTQVGQSSAVGGETYHLSVMLGYTAGRGNAVNEIIAYLRRSALADGSHPKGTVYLMQVENEVRSTTRAQAFPEVALALRQLGMQAEIEKGVLPVRRDDVIGAVVGRADFDWGRSRSRMLPGAICEHLTSFGGVLRANARQTPMTEFLRFGAAGASGTVVEPFALQEKFPHPWVHVHYARGASMAEAFYQSVATPYQLLIIGDPICRPYARSPQVTLDGLTRDEEVSGVVNVTPRAAGAVPVREHRLFVDGRYMSACRPGESMKIDTQRLGDGYHEVCVVSVEDSPVESQGRVVIPIQIRNGETMVEWALQPKTIGRDQQARILLNAPEAKAIYLFHHRRLIGRVNQSRGALSVDARRLGRGPVTLTAVAIGREPKQRTFSTPIRLDINEGLSLNSTLTTSQP